MKKAFITLLLTLFSFNINAKNNIQDYQRIFLPMYLDNGELRMAIRVFKMNDVPSFLIVNPHSLETAIMPINKLFPRKVGQTKTPGYFTQSDIKNTRYYEILNRGTAAPYALENQGITHANNVKEGNILTIDLCPSVKKFEAKFFKSLEQLSDNTKEPTPITIAISGMWLIEHPEEFNWLIKKQRENKLAITWANHSFSHVFYSDLPYSENFLLSQATNVDLEILLTEKYLLEAGELPSVFFRFPGLISNENLMKELKKYGLIPLGSDAWVAKQQAITPGGIILVHGNSNEPAGIAGLLPQLKKLKFLDIKNSL